MSSEFYRKLVDLYASHELPLALEEEMELAALTDPELGQEMRSLRATFDALKDEAKPEYTREIHERIFMSVLMKQYGAEIASDKEDFSHLYQYQLPIQG